jgi:hypothetical protein
MFFGIFARGRPVAVMVVARLSTLVGERERGRRQAEGKRRNASQRRKARKREREAHRKCAQKRERRSEGVRGGRMFEVHVVWRHGANSTSRL